MVAMHLIREATRRGIGVGGGPLVSPNFERYDNPPKVLRYSSSQSSRAMRGWMLYLVVTAPRH